MADAKIIDALKPLLSDAALNEMLELSEVMDAMAHSKRDKLRANAISLLLENHEKRRAARDFIQDNDLQEYTVAYDMTRCDGECLVSDIDALLSRAGAKS